jgi:hypothetical protein
MRQGCFVFTQGEENFKSKHISVREDAEAYERRERFYLRANHADEVISEEFLARTGKCDFGNRK